MFLGRSLVSGRRRSPSPPAMISAYKLGRLGFLGPLAGLPGLRRLAQFVYAVGLLPGRVDVVAAEVAVGARRAVDGAAQVEVADDGVRAEVEDARARGASGRGRRCGTCACRSVSTDTPIGCGCPMAYESSTSTRSASPAATRFFATQRAA